MSNKVIGILDSGLGGYTVYNALRNVYPAFPFVFFADQKNAPYGDKQVAEIFDCARNCIRWFEKQGIQEVIIACNTISSTCLEQLKASFPLMTLHGIIDLTVQQFYAGQFRTVSVIATQATISSGQYGQKLRELDPLLSVSECATPYLVPMIEQLSDPELIKAQFAHDTLSLIDNTDALILGCTHYPLVTSLIESCYPLPIFDSIQPIIDLLRKQDMTSTGASCVYTSKDPDMLKYQIKVLYHEDIEVNKAKEEIYEDCCRQ